MPSINMEEVNNFLLTCSPETKIYIGCDSTVIYKNNTRYAKYTSVIVIHIDGCRGGIIFHESDTEVDLSVGPRKPNVRLMNEVYRASALYLRMLDDAPYSQLLDIEVHLDINPDKSAKSSSVVQEAIGYIRGTCQIDPVLKPEAMAASTVADHL